MITSPDAQTHASPGLSVLLLNASYEPLCVISARRAIVLVLVGKAVGVEDSGLSLHSAAASIEVPIVIRLVRYVRVPYSYQVPLTRRALLARDAGTCAYCGQAATTIDHIVPRSRGGAHTWDNVVSACARCNQVKADRALAELGWSLPVKPGAPTGSSWRVLRGAQALPQWEPYLAAA